MAGEPATRGSDQPPSEDEIGNHHWSTVSNYFVAHGSAHAPHHSHPGIDKQELRKIHDGTGKFEEILIHDDRATYHHAMEMPGCRDTSNVAMRED